MEDHPPSAAGAEPLVLEDRHVVVLAVATLVGARLAWALPLAAGPALAVVSLLVAARRPCLPSRRLAGLLGLALAVLASSLADRALAGLDPVFAAPYAGWVQLVTDPAPLDGGGVRVDVLADGRRLEATAFGVVAGLVERHLAGERLLLEGDLRPPPAAAPWLVPRRVVGRLSVDAVHADAPGSAATRAANGLRRAFAEGAAGLPLRARSLLSGVVLGDDREQPPEVVDDFRAAGLGHLVVVSGQNVAFLLMAFGPLLRRLRWRARLPATLVLLGAFALVVRFEPSVLRAVAMAGIATVAAATGRPAAGGRILALAVTGLVLVDPLLVRSVGFLLSASASAAILVLAPRLRVAVGGPRWFAEPLSVTLAAQIGTAPLLLATFGPLPVASVPANLLAVPVAGVLMVWGIATGFVAGWLPVLHRPGQVLAWWLATVADRCAALPLGSIDGRRALVLLAVVPAAVAVRRLDPDRRLAPRRPVAVAACVVVVLSAALARPTPPANPVPVAEVGTLRTVDGERVLVVDGRGGAGRALEALRLAGARCVDVVAVERASPGGVALAGALRRRCDGVVVVAEAGVARPGWLAVAPGEDLVAAALAAARGG